MSQELASIERRWRIDSWRLWISIVAPISLAGLSCFAASLWFVANLNARVSALENERIADQVQFTAMLGRQTTTTDKLVEAVDGLKTAVTHLQDYYEQTRYRR